jgi:hypothetical protein
MRTCAFRDFNLFVITAALYFRCRNIECVFENRVLRKIIGSKREDAAGGWIQLHSEELRNL